MTRSERIDALVQLGEELKNPTGEDWEQLFARVYAANAWFTRENIERAMQAIAEHFLNKEALEAWTLGLPDIQGPGPRQVGLIMAGNIPLAGFHDWLCVYIYGHRALVKLSQKDNLLLPFLTKKLGKIAHASWAYTTFLGEYDRLRDFDAVIATGSDNAARYFEQYFGKYHHIIRKNRNSIAVLDGSESSDELMALGKDVFSYFGLGCRNVSKLYLPEDYDLGLLLDTLHEYRDIVLHNKYKNNFDYNYTLFLMNQTSFFNNGCVMLIEDPRLTARIATVHYEFYKDRDELKAKIQSQRDGIQCGVGKMQLDTLSLLPFGNTQSPGLSDYADGVDVLAFLEEMG